MTGWKSEGVHHDIKTWTQWSCCPPQLGRRKTELGRDEISRKPVLTTHKVESARSGSGKARGLGEEGRLSDLVISSDGERNVRLILPVFLARDMVLR
jgi:hypothetical protein